MSGTPIQSEYEFKAFISYRHVPRDIAAAEALHTQIERYTVPTGRKQNTSRSRSKWKVFRDEEELRITNDLPQSIHEALDASEYLIVVCSPDAMHSKWVPLEIAHFLEHHDRDHVLTVVTAGDPEQMLPVLLDRLSAEGYDTSRMNEPLYMDIRAGNNRRMKRLLKERFLKLAATLHGCAYDDLVMREQRRRRTQFLQRLAMVVCFFASIIAVLLWSNHQIIGKNQELEQKNEQLFQQQQEILLRESENLTAQSLDALREGNHFSAIKSAVSALPAFEGERSYYLPAEKALISSLELLNNQSNHFFFEEATVESNVPISDFCMKDDGNAVAWLDQYGTVSFYDLQNEEVLWKQSLSESEYYHNGTILYCSAQNAVMVYFQNDGITCLDCDTGEVNWFCDTGYSMDIRPQLSADQQILIVYTISQKHDETLDEYTEDGHLLVISTESGEVLQDINLSEHLSMEGYELDLVYAGRDVYDGISADNRTFIGYYLTDDAMVYFSADLTSGTAAVMFTMPLNNYDFSYLFFLEGDTQCVAIQSGFQRNIPGRIVKFDIDTAEIVWSEDLPVIRDSMYLFCEEMYYQETGNNLVVVKNNVFMLYDLYSGEQKNAVELEHYVEHLFQNGLDSFGAILSDGSFVTISIAINDLGEDVLIVEDICSLGLDIDNLIYYNHVAYTSVLLNGSAVETVFDPNGNLVIAAVNVHDVFNIEISHKIPISDTLAPKQLQFAGSMDSIWNAEVTTINDEYIVIGPFIDYSFGEDCFYILLDSHSLLPVCCIPVFDENDNFIYFLPDGSGYTYSGAWYDFDGNIIQQTPMLKAYQHLIATVNGSPMHVYTGAPYDQIKIWYGGREYLTAQLPEYLLHNERYDYLGNNGYYVCAAIDAPPEERVYFAVLDIWDNEWFRIPSDYTIETFYWGPYDQEPFCIGNESPLMAIWSRKGTLCVYNCDDGCLVNEFFVDIPPASLISMEFIVDDSYIMLQTDDGLLLILEAASGTVVYNEVLYTYTFSNVLFRPYYDKQDRRLFICGDLEHHGICLDTNTWTKMASIPGMIGYDSETNLVYQATVDPETAENRITASYFPPADELIEIARELVGIDER